ncbi:MAG: iron-sulfur cluster loop [Desulfurococcales archaeon ex4484_58]|nr:MAG: iron-sulfur cluster loop [Desulfurococcales archaeon ex4484_58]
MSMIGIDQRSVDRVSRILVKRNIEFRELNVFDEKYYPGRNVDEENVIRYFFVMVAMDHRLSRPGKPYEACLDDGCYHGADLLYRLGKKMFDENPEFFSPKNLAKISVDQVKFWLSVEEVGPPDPTTRAYLLRDLGLKILKLYGGETRRIVVESNNRLKGTIEKPGLVDHLKVFKAYEDPVEKKALLLAKFLIKRGIFKPVDQLDMPIDNHLTRIALRLGLVMVSGELWDKIRKGVEVSVEEDVLIRLFVRRAYRSLAIRSRVKPDILDDHFWLMGREICLRDKPLCDKCLFKQVCLAKNNPAFMVNEHILYNTWYY